MSAVMLLPAGTVSESGYFVAGDVPFVAQGCSVARPGQLDEEGLRRVTGRGVNTIRLWSDYYETGELDLDGLRAARAFAERLDFRLLLVLFSPAFVSDIYEETSRFDRGLTMFNRMCRQPAEVVEHAEAFDAILDRCRAILSVFEDSPALLGWEIVNQTDDLYEVGPAAMADFIRRLADAVRQEDRKVGQTRLVTASSFQPVPPAWLLGMDELDFTAFHAYARSVHDPTNRIDGAVHVGAALRYALACQPRPRPVLDTESGAIAQVFDPAAPRPDLDFRGELAHNLRWAHFASGGAGTGLHIPVNDEGQCAERRVPLSRLGWGPLTAELDDIDAIGRLWSLAPGRGPVRALAESLHVGAGDVFGFASATPGRVVGWLLRDTRASDLAADVDGALACGPTTLASLDRRLQALDEWSAALQQILVDAHNQYSRKAISMLLRRGRSGVRRACELVDEGLDQLLAVTRQVAPSLLDERPGSPAGVEVRIFGLGAGLLELRWVDDVTGSVIAGAQVRGPTVTVTSPPLDRHMAFVVTAVEDGGAGSAGA
jgi:hypothetical protein